jgi:hypothetical protein
MPPVRRLTAILAADVAGYSRPMGADEEGTHDRLKAHLRSWSIRRFPGSWADILSAATLKARIRLNFPLALTSSMVDRNARAM